MKKLIFVYFAIIFLIGCLVPAAAAQGKKPKTKAKPVISLTSSGDEEVVFGLKDALSNGTNHASSELGKQGGFYSDPRVRLSMPPALQELEKKLRGLKYDDLVDDLVVSMNRAAEQSITESSFAVSDALRQMTIQDPKKVLAGPKDAATQYFRRTSQTALLAKILPLVQTSMAENEVVAKFKVLVEKGGGVSTPPGQKPFNLDEYIAQKTLDGMFVLIADQEKRIREDPAARTTAILQKVFGSNIK
jgi:hypothetical protein